MVEVVEDPRVRDAVSRLRASILHWFSLRVTMEVDPVLLWAAECCGRAVIWARFSKEEADLRLLRRVQAFVSYRKEWLLTERDARTAWDLGDWSYRDAEDLVGKLPEYGRGTCPAIPAGWSAGVP